MSEPQTSNVVLLVRPAAFGFHAEAAPSNAFAAPSPAPELQQPVAAEFDGVVHKLEDAGIEVLVINDSPEPSKPDAIFPNNWVSFHADGTIVLYPMATMARRLERDVDRLAPLLGSCGFEVRRTVDLTRHELEGRFLEGTGSLILDRPRRRAFANRSARTHPAVIAEFDVQLDYSTLLFDAADPDGRPIYHTNVIMSLGTRFAVLCSKCVAAGDRDTVVGEIEASGRRLIDLSFNQIRSFAGNIIELRRADGRPAVVISSAAVRSLDADQLSILETAGGSLLEVDIPTIEAVGGGGIRCMIADVHLPRAESAVG